MMQEWLKANQPIDKEDLARHDKWLCMMMPRLKLLRELLRDDGVIFISIDDNEVHHLKVVLEEIFFEFNFIGTVIWKGATDNNPTQIAVEHEYLLCFAKDKQRVGSTWKNASNSAKELILAKYRSLGESIQSIEEVQKQFRKFIRDNHESLAPLTHYTQIDERGVYTGSRKVHNPKPGGYEYNVIHPNGKVCVSPANGYRYPKETMNSLLKEERILFGRDEKQVIQIKEYLENFEAKLSSVIQLDSRIASNRLQSLFPKQSKVFPNPKPVELLSEILGFVTCENDIILDSFAGSGTTAHAVLALNQEDGGNRKFILVEMEDYADTLTAERVRRVIQGIPNAKDEALKNGLGGSFSFFELGDAIEMQAILEGDKLPAYEDLARYVFYAGLFHSN